MQEQIFEVICPHCQKKNRVYVTLRDAFNQKEEFACDYCGLEIGSVSAAEPPRTEYVEEDAES